MRSADLPAQCTVALEAGENIEFLNAKLNQVFGQGPAPAKVLVLLSGSEPKISAGLPAFSGKCEFVEAHRFRQHPQAYVLTPFLAYLPAKAPYSRPVLEDLEKSGSFIRPWVPSAVLSETEWVRQTYADLGWISTPDFFQEIGQKIRLEESLSLLGLEGFSRKTGFHLPYFSAPSNTAADKTKISNEVPSRLSAKSRVLALVPYFNCEPWLEQCLDSLVNQTRPPDAIAVLDDASSRPPLEVLKKFERVTLMRSSENVGPYRLLQSAIEKTQFDAYLFQDSDDWSCRDRLERLLGEGERTGAEWIGTQELMVFENSIYAIRYPLDADSVRQTPLTHPFCYPGSLISGDFLTRLGGFASGLRFSGDLELLSRAVWAGKVVNLDRYGYFRRIRKDSLTTSEATGLGSPARREVGVQIAKRKEENRNRAAKGLLPLLEPLRTAGPVGFEHLTGPGW